MIEKHSSRDDIIALGYFEEEDTILGETYIFIPYLRFILERMEEISSFGVITLGQTPHTAECIPPLLQISFVNQYSPHPYKHVEKEGIFLAPRSPMPPRLCDESPCLIDEFLDKNKVLFERPFANEIYRRREP